MTLPPEPLCGYCMCPKQLFRVVQCSWCNLSWMYGALQCTHILFCPVYGTQKDMTAQQMQDTALTTALRHTESWTSIPISVLWTPPFITSPLLRCTKTPIFERNHRKRCAVFVQKLIIDVSQTPQPWRCEGETLKPCKGQLYQDLPIQRKELRQNDELPTSSCVFKQMTNY